MKRFTKICLTAGAALLVLGLLVGGIGWLLGAGRDIRNSRTETAGQQAELTIPGETLGRLEVTLTSEDLQILPSQDKDAHIQYTVMDQRDYATIFTRGNAHGKDTCHFSYSADAKHSWHLFNLSFGSYTKPVTVYLPEGYDGDLSVSAISGEVTARDLSAGTCDFQTTSGDLELSGLTCGDLEVSTTSGEVTLDRVRAGDGSIQTVSGDTETEGSAFARLQITTTSGEVELSGGNVTGGVRCQTISGDVTVQDTGAASLDCRTVSGDITVLGGDQIGDIQYTTTSGSVQIDGR